jgi:hypothetical protein
MSDCCSAASYGAPRNRLDPNTSAFAGDQRAVPIHSPRFRSGHTVPHCNNRRRRSNRSKSPHGSRGWGAGVSHVGRPAPRRPARPRRHGSSGRTLVLTEASRAANRSRHADWASVRKRDAAQAPARLSAVQFAARCRTASRGVRGANASGRDPSGQRSWAAAGAFSGMPRRFAERDGSGREVLPPPRASGCEDLVRYSPFDLPAAHVCRISGG